MNHLVRFPSPLLRKLVAHGRTVDTLRAAAAPMGSHRRRRGRHSRYVCHSSPAGTLCSLSAELKVKTVKYFKSIERVQEEVEALHAKLKDDPSEPEQVGSME